VVPKVPAPLGRTQSVSMCIRRIVASTLTMAAMAALSACGSSTSTAEPKTTTTPPSCSSPTSCVHLAVKTGFIGNISLQVPSSIVARFQQGETTPLGGVDRQFFSFRYVDRPSGARLQETATANPPFFQRCTATSAARPVVSPGGRAVCFVVVGGQSGGSFVTFANQNIAYQFSISGERLDTADEKAALLEVVDHLQSA